MLCVLFWFVCNFILFFEFYLFKVLKILFKLVFVLCEWMGKVLYVDKRKKEKVSMKVYIGFIVDEVGYFKVINCFIWEKC